MKIQALALALALAFAGGTAFAAAPTDTAKASDTAAAKKTTKHHKKATKKRVTHSANKKPVSTSYQPQTNVNDTSRQSRMDEALAKYRQGHS